MITLHVITPVSERLSATVRQVVFTAHDGKMGVLTGHAAMITRLAAGMLRYQGEDGTFQELYLEEGFCQIRDDAVVILAGQVIEKHQITLDGVREQLRTAQNMPTMGKSDAEARSRAIRRATILLRWIQSETGNE